MGPRDRFYPYLYHCDYIGLLGTGFMQVLYLGRAPRTKETLPDFLKWRRVTRHLLVFRGLTGSQRTPGFGVLQALSRPSIFIISLLLPFMTHEYLLYLIFVASKIVLRHLKRDASKNVTTPTVSEFHEILRAS